MEEAIKKAIKGGYRGICGDKTCELYNFNKHLVTLRGWTVQQPTIYEMSIWQVVCDPLFWQALGKMEGLEGSTYSWQLENEEKWLTYWKLFIDHLAERGSVDEFFNKLLRCEELK